MKKILAVSTVLAAFLGIFLGLTQAADAVPLTCVNGTVLVAGNTASVSHDPDSGHHGTWAYDTFTRTTDVTVTDCLLHTYQVVVRDAGTFTTLPDASSPRQGVPLPATPVTGGFTGSTSYTVTSLQPPYNPTITPIVGSPGTSTWWQRFFKPSDRLTGGEGYYSWTYATACEKWIDASTNNDGQAKNAGDITGKTCKVTPPPTTTTAPPTTTQVPPPTTNTGSTGGGSTVTTVQQVTTVPVGAPQTGFGGSYVSTDEWLLYASVLALLLGFGGTALLLLRGTRVTQ